MSNIGMVGEDCPETGQSYAKTDYEKSRTIGQAKVSSFYKHYICDAAACVDAVIILLCSVLAKFLYIDGYLQADQPLSLSFPLVGVGAVGAFLYIAMMRGQGRYKLENFASHQFGSFSTLKTLLLTFLIIIALGFLVKEAESYSRGWLVTWFVLSFVSLSIARLLFSTYINNRKRRGYFDKRVAVLGTGHLADRVVEHLSGEGTGVTVVGRYSDAPRTMSDDRNFGDNQWRTISELITHGQNNDFEEVIIALQPEDSDKFDEAIDRLNILPLNIVMLPNEYVFNMRNSSIALTGDLPLLTVKGNPIGKWGRLSKMVLDFVLGAIFTVIFAIPMLLIALAIKLSDTKSPIFFGQQRHGFNHKVFTVWKFRTMRVMENDEVVQQATKNDSRVTFLGRYLRATSLDELPQLYNVLRGEMSLVGPRPHAVAHNNEYAAKLARYAQRHKVMPGITGWAQINGARGETNTLDLMEKRVNYDLHYIENWSFWLDIKILLKTPFHFMGKNAY